MKSPDAYGDTTWQIQFKLDQPIRRGLYKLRIALASAIKSQLKIWINDRTRATPHFSTGIIGYENSIARLGIHGVYRLFHVDVDSSLLVTGENIIFLNQAVAVGPFVGIMYDYIRLEEPVVSVSNGRLLPWIAGIYLHSTKIIQISISYYDLLLHRQGRSRS